MYDVAPTAPLSPVNPEDFSVFKDRELLQNEKSEFFREADVNLAVLEGSGDRVGSH